MLIIATDAKLVRCSGRLPLDSKILFSLPAARVCQLHLSPNRSPTRCRKSGLDKAKFCFRRPIQDSIAAVVYQGQSQLTRSQFSARLRSGGPCPFKPKRDGLQAHSLKSSSGAGDRPLRITSDKDVEASFVGEDDSQGLEAGVIPESRLLAEDPTSSPSGQASTSGRNPYSKGAGSLLYPPAQRSHIRESW